MQAGEFKKVVKFLGERRAWKTKDISNVDFGLNTSEGVPESKRYEEKSFDIGLNGSKKASAWFKKHIPFGLHLVEKNTLRLITNKEGEMDVEPTPIHNTIKLTDKNMLSNCRRTLGFTPFTKDTHTPPRLIATEKTNPYANNPAMNLSHKRYPEGIGLLARQNNRVTDESSGMLSPQENEEIAIQHAIDLLSTSTSSARHFNLSGKDIAQIQKVHAALLWFKLNNTHYEDIHIHSDYGPNQQGNRSIFFKRTETEETFIKQHLKSNFLESFKKSALDNTPIFKKNPANY